MRESKVSKKGTTITVLSRTIKTTIKTNKMPDVAGFIQAMKDMGGKVLTREDGAIVIDLHQGAR
ncbi:unnamed protein product [marine sediment metagenome]|uniref:Uncharacterized protein n=1 Tax=marine sediment metagenome TaxID=412755 RepID=X1RRQ1_9ZZZZ